MYTHRIEFINLSIIFSFQFCSVLMDNVNSCARKTVNVLWANDAWMVSVYLLEQEVSDEPYYL